MKKLILALAVCFAFVSYAIVTKSDTKLNNIERLEKKINVLKAERKNIYSKLPPLRDEMRVAMEKRRTLKEKIISLERNKVLGVTYYKALIEKKENDVKNLTLFAAEYSIYPDLNKINLDIDKAKIELIKAEIKAGKMPEVPLDVAKAMIKYSKAVVKLNEARIKAIDAKIKEKEAYIEWIEFDVEMLKKVEETIKNTDDFARSLYNTNTNIEFAELGYKQTKLELKLKQVRRKRVQLEIQQAQTHAESCKNEHKFYKTILKFEKVIDEKNLKKFLNRD
ncbi:MAG: hypothetical protein LBJ98_02425 [Endomicrobium sp.]|jgi:hypothetical protein|nr:hypothetical protein [Endomicrobium sp.]